MHDYRNHSPKRGLYSNYSYLNSHHSWMESLLSCMNCLHLECLTYFQMAKKYHPDVNKDADASKKFQEVSEAYEVMSELNTCSKVILSIYYLILSYSYWTKFVNLRWGIKSPSGLVTIMVWFPPNSIYIPAEFSRGLIRKKREAKHVK